MDPDHRSVWYIAGRSGSGKSTFAAMLLKTFKKLHPKKPIYFFSRTAWKDDPAYEKIKPEQVKIDISLVDKPIIIEKDIEKGAALVFDDIGTIHDKPIREEVYHLISDALEVGRKLDLSVILTSHLINPNEKAFGRTVLNETQNLVLFPHGSTVYQITYVLQKYYGLDKKAIADILKLPSRWVVISQTVPMAIMHEHGLYTI
jgi:energy-coupling factor transporter ATP-binding protein EcfA2